jgi:WD40 repeat protein
VDGVAFSPDGTRIFTGGPYCTAKVWDARAGQLVLTLPIVTGDVLSVAFSPDGTRILTGCSCGTATVCDAENGTEILTITGHQSEGQYCFVNCVAFCPDGTRALTGSQRATARVWLVDDAPPRANPLAAAALAGDTTAALALADWLEERGEPLDLIQAAQLRMGNLYPAGFWV